MLKILFLFSISLFSKEVMVDGTAAVIDKRLITVQDVYFYRAIHNFISSGSVNFELVEAKELTRDLNKLILEQILIREIGRRDFSLLLPQEIREKISSNSFRKILSHFRRKESEAIQIILRSIETEKFLKKHIEVLTPIITNKEVELYYNQNKNKFINFKSAQSEIEQVLKIEKRNAAMENWITFLKNKYKVRRLISD